MSTVGFIVLFFVTIAFFTLSRTHPPRKKIAVLSPTVCTYGWQSPGESELT